jgi:hypothetical protein
MKTGEMSSAKTPGAEAAMIATPRDMRAIRLPWLCDLLMASSKLSMSCIRGLKLSDFCLNSLEHAFHVRPNKFLVGR